MNPSRNRLKRSKAPHILVPFLIVLLFAGLIHILMPYYGQCLGKTITGQMDSLITVEYAVPLSFREIRMAGIRFNTSLDSTMTMRSVTIRFSLIDALMGRLTIEKINLDNVHLYSTQEALPRISENLSSAVFQKKTAEVPRDVDINFRHSDICFDDLEIHIFSDHNPEQTRAFVMDICIDRRFDHVVTSGSFNLEKSTMIDNLLRDILKNQGVERNTFEIDTQFLKGDLMVNKAGFQIGPYSVSCAGMIQDIRGVPAFDLKLYTNSIRIDEIKMLRSLKPVGGALAVNGQIKGLWPNVFAQAHFQMPTLELNFENDEMALDHFSARLQYDFREKEFWIKRIDGKIDDQIRLRARLRAKDFKQPLWDYVVYFEPLQERTFSDQIKIRGRGRFLKELYDGSIYFSVHSPLLKEKFEIAFNDVFYKWEETGQKRPILHLKIPAFNVIESKEKSDTFEPWQSFHFRNAQGQLQFKGRQTHIRRFEIPGYGGCMILRGDVKFGYRRMLYALTLNIDEVFLQNFRLSNPVGGVLTGKISGSLAMDNKHDFDCKGLLMAKDFSLMEIEPLDQVAEFLGIDSIRNITNGELITEFSISPRFSEINFFDFDGEDFKLRSQFQINEKQWMDGHIALSMPRFILEESKIFRKLLAMARERDDQVDFVIHLSGFLGALRLELIESQFRDKLKERINQNIQKYIVREINKALEP